MLSRAHNKQHPDQQHHSDQQHHHIQHDDAWRQLCQDVRTFLAYQGELGLEGVQLPSHIFSCARLRPSSPVIPASPPVILASPPVIPAQAGIQPAQPTSPNASNSLQQIRDELGDCQRCKLCKGRTHIVFGVGDANARLMFVGEGPGRDEDLQGEPFVGEAGKLLTRMIVAMKLSRQQVYIANVIKCRPPRNRDPEPDEVAACEPFLKAQIAAVAPDVVVALGRVAAQNLLQSKTPISRLRGQWCSYAGRPLMPTFHPAYLLRNPADKKLVWQDLQQVMQRLAMI